MLTAAAGRLPHPGSGCGQGGCLPGTDGVNKMSEFGYAIFLTDELKQIKKKLGKLYTGRQSPDEPGDIEMLFQYVRTFTATPTAWPNWNAVTPRAMTLAMASSKSRSPKPLTGSSPHA